MTERKKLNRGVIFPINIAPGIIRVNNAVVERDYGDCILLCVDLRSKYAELQCISSFNSGFPCVFLSANRDTLYIDDNKDQATVIEFTGLTGWTIWSVSGPYRYSVYVTLIAPDELDNSCTAMESPEY